ncbi:uncharacterized protein LOC120710351 isoform X2 [Panicum virgatum]|uniref:uncharacterized protein LOC120710351 isoform X2 n=1 Tax=Panicum virgatum TaxID=38727 RepID=UPI0019D67C18|nr:uncharacterized protein LOC120710351 isoform X2 [Panicum virgatum]
MAFYGSNFSDVFLQLCSLLSSDRLKLDGQRDCGSHLHGLGRNPPQASSVEARMPQLLSGPALALSLVKVIDPVRARINVCGACKGRIPARGLLVSSGGTGLRHTFHPVSAVGSGRDSSITEAERKSDLSLENVKTSIVSRDDEMINVRVQLPGKATQKIFDEALTFLARDAPPVPGFRKSKGDTQQHPPADARQKPGHQVRPSGDTHHHHRRIYQEGKPQGEPRDQDDPDRKRDGVGVHAGFGIRVQCCPAARKVRL